MRESPVGVWPGPWAPPPDRDTLAAQPRPRWCVAPAAPGDQCSSPSLSLPTLGAPWALAKLTDPSALAGPNLLHSRGTAHTCPASAMATWPGWPPALEGCRAASLGPPGPHPPLAALSLEPWGELLSLPQLLGSLSVARQLTGHPGPREHMAAVHGQASSPQRGRGEPRSEVPVRRGARLNGDVWLTPVPTLRLRGPGVRSPRTTHSGSTDTVPRAPREQRQGLHARPDAHPRARPWSRCGHWRGGGLSPALWVSLSCSPRPSSPGPSLGSPPGPRLESPAVALGAGTAAGTHHSPSAFCPLRSGPGWARTLSSARLPPGGSARPRPALHLPPPQQPPPHSAPAHSQPFLPPSLPPTPHAECWGGQASPARPWQPQASAQVQGQGHGGAGVRLWLRYSPAHDPRARGGRGAGSTEQRSLAVPWVSTRPRAVARGRGSWTVVGSVFRKHRRWWPQKPREGTRPAPASR